EEKRLNKENSSVLARKDKEEAKYQELKAEYDSSMSYRDIQAEHVGAANSESEKKVQQDKLAKMDQDLQRIKAKLDQAHKRLNDTKGEIEEKVNAPLRKMDDETSLAEEQLKRLTGVFDRFARTTAQKRWKFGDFFRGLPIIDGFASPTKIDQIVLNELPID